MKSYSFQPDGLTGHSLRPMTTADREISWMCHFDWIFFLKNIKRKTSTDLADIRVPRIEQTRMEQNKWLSSWNIKCLSIKQKIISKIEKKNPNHLVCVTQYGWSNGNINHINTTIHSSSKLDLVLFSFSF